MLEKRKVVRRRVRKHKRMRGSVSILLVLAMLLAASISAVAFAVSSDEGTDVAVTNEVYVPVPAEEAPAEAPPGQ